jgi:actin-related protein
VVDLGWAETITTGLYEYREVTTKRSTRATKAVLQELGRLLTSLASSPEQDSASADEISVGFRYCEEIASRLAWCRVEAPNEENDHLNQNVSIPSPTNPEQEFIEVPFSRLAEPVEKALFAPGVPESELDDEEKPIPLLVYKTLLALPPDVRGTCMSRIVFVGGGARIPGLRQRILKDVSQLIDQHGWSPIRGKVIERQRQRLAELRISSPINGENQLTPTDTASSPINEKSDPSKDEPEVDFVEQKLRRQNKNTPVPVQGILREVDSLGAWAGASLVTSLKIRGMVEVEREKFLQHGLAGGTRDSEPAPDRRSGLRAGDRSSWTLAGWA